MNVPVKLNFKFWPIISALFIKCWFLWCSLAILLLITYFTFGFFWTSVFFFSCVLVALYTGQDRLLYHPDPENLQSRLFVQAPSVLDLPFENIFIKSLDGTQIHLFLITQPEETLSNCPTLVFFHGNAGNMGHRLHNAAGMYSNLKCNILMVEYRGYGLSKGSPSESGLCMDAQAALDFLFARNDIDKSQIIVFGRSLGGAVAIDLTSKPEYSSRIWCLVLENTFTNIPDMAKTLLAWTFLRYVPTWFYKNKFLSDMKISSVTIPALFISGLDDNLVPPSMMVDLFILCGSREKNLIKIKQGSHNNTWTCPGYYSNISNFLQSIEAYKPEPMGPPSIVTNI